MNLARLMKTVNIFERGQDRRYRLKVILTDIAIDWIINQETQWVSLMYSQPLMNLGNSWSNLG